MRKRISLVLLPLLASLACGVSTQTTAPSNSSQLSYFKWERSVRAISISDVGHSENFSVQLDRAISLGFTAVRIPLDWSSLEPVRANYDWRELDAAVNATRVRGIPVMAAVGNAPSWSRDPRFSGISGAPPRDQGDLASFIAAAAERYRGAITAWEIFPGANSATNFEPNVDAQQMCALMKSAYSAVKGVDRSNIVITGGTVQVGNTPRSIAPARFVQQLYICAKGFFDGIGMSPSTGKVVITSASGVDGAASAINSVHQVAVLNGDAQRPIYFTGFGMPTGPAGVNENAQAEGLVTGIHYLRGRDFAGTTVVAELEDRATGSPNPDDNLGLIRSDGSAKPSLRAVTAMRG